MSSSARVLTGLMERRALEAAFSGLASARGVEQLAERAQGVAAFGNAAIPILVSLLDTADPQLRGGLGQVAALLDREATVAALRRAALTGDRTDQARLTALMILDRFLGETMDESLLTGLQNPDAVAVQSLHELAREMESNPAVILEYLSQLSEQPPEVAAVVLDAVPLVEPVPAVVTLLRMFAQGSEDGIAGTALDHLSRQRTPLAAHALMTLARTLPPARAAVAARGYRKLCMSGVPQPQRQDAGKWRALLSPVDGSGAQVIWFMRRPQDGPSEEDGRGTLFSVLCKDPDGIIASFGTGEVPAADLPPEQPVGQLYLMQDSRETPPIALLEAPVAFGLAAVQRALALHWEAGTQPAAEYRLLNPQIWELDVEPSWTCPAGGEFPAVEMSALLDHPAFATWCWAPPAVYDAAQRLGRRHTLAARRAHVDALARRHMDRATVASYCRRLEAMAAWLALAGEERTAALAAATAQQLAGQVASESPLLLRLISLGIDVAMAGIRSGFTPRRAQPGGVVPAA